MIHKNNDMELRKIIMDHYTKPKFKGFVKNKNSKIFDLKSLTCSDELQMQLLIKNEKIELLKFDGNACSIATAAADLIIKNAQNKNIDDVKKIINSFNKLMENKIDKTDEKNLNELIVFKNVYKQKNRIICATLFSKGLEENI